MKTWQILTWTEDIKASALEFLHSKWDSAFYLNCQLYQHGPQLTNHSGSGNISLILKDSVTIGAISFTRRGLIQIELDGKYLSEDLEEAILDHLVAEPLSIRGIMGTKSAIDPLWARLIYWGIGSESAKRTDEVNMSHENLSEFANFSCLGFQKLSGEFFEPWLQLRCDYLSEMNALNTVHSEGLELSFQEGIKKGSIFGIIEDEKLIAITHFNGISHDLGVIGGVYTHRDYRGRGYGRKIIAAQLSHGFLIGLKRVVLHVGVANEAALNVYNTLGFEGKSEFASILI